uniref:Uncharacterized protein n=1 Tax=Meloidogyne incognita TaxID=6306 RepID=A0A914LDJ4_MELIC
MLAKILIISCLIIQTHSWTWKDYPSPRGTTYWKCGISDYFCDPEEMLTDQQRKEIGEVLEDIQEKTKRPNSTVPSMREGVSLLVALSNFEFDLDDGSFRYTDLCTNDRIWMLADTTKGGLDVQKIELVNTNGFLYCYSIRDLMLQHNEEYKLPGRKTHQLKKVNYLEVLKNYLENLLKLYNQRFSSFDSSDASKEDNITVSEERGLKESDKKQAERQQSLDQGNETLTDFHKIIEEINKDGIISILICLIIGLVLLFLIYRICQVGKYFKRTPIKTVEAVEKKERKKEEEERSKLLLNP